MSDETQTIEAPAELDQAAPAQSSELVPAATATPLSTEEIADRRLERRALGLSKSQIAVPRDPQGRAADIFALLIRADSLGINQMSMIQGSAVVNGKIVMSSDLYLAVALGAGCRVTETLEQGNDPDDVSEWVAVCIVERNEHKTEERFSMQDAERAGLLARAKEGSPWRQYPQRMLKHRARAFAIRTACADLLAGVQMTDEAIDSDFRDVTPPDA